MRALKVVEQVQEPEITTGSSWNGRLQMASLAPNGVKKLRELILKLAVCGKLVPQDPKDEPAIDLFKRIRAGKEKKTQEIDGEELPHPLPKGWMWIRNGQLFTLKKGKNPKNLYEAKRGLPYLDIAALDKGVIRRYTDDASALQSTEEDLLVVCDGSRSGLILDGKKGVVGSTIAVVQCSQEVKGYLKVMFLAAYEHLNKEKKGAAIPHLNTAKLIKTVIGLPPAAEQKRIVAKVDELMALCDRLEAQKQDAASAHEMLVKVLLGTLTQSQAAEEFQENWRRIASSSGSLFASFASLFSTESSIDALKQTILQLAVMGKLVPQNPKDEPASELLKRIKIEKEKLIKLGKIKKEKPLEEVTDVEHVYPLPKNWCWARISEYSLFTEYGLSEKTFDMKDGVPVLKMGDIQNGRVLLGGQKRVSKKVVGLPGLLLKKNDLLYNRTNSAELVGKTGIYLGADDEYTFASYLIRIRCSEGLSNPHYLNLAMCSPLFRKTQINPHIIQQCGQANVNGSILKNMLVPIPPLNEQSRIVAKVDEIMALCDSLKENLSRYNALHEHLATALVEKALAA